ncbi:hypothetical protein CHINAEXTREME_08155 [Halobiforma lacisalsi AJ5]|uniref:LWR-salt protein n=2 Tax=Natronobacterium TaxID=2256 RepID=M0LVP0_NATLA|nr:MULTISPECIES: LWR-salt protein [Halobiforma]APW97750.1 hypothetical protein CHINAEXTREME_08155 [Halobiforma lacisalsi AJ5]EMA37506.1 hypothetical protein C445_01426 [Halobiforma lacisalsi AJ5]SFB85043.1 hypothetical protein SAMN05444422_102384 [Halobiforma haloterrestris]
MHASYVFRVTVRLESEAPSVSIDPASARTELTVHRDAPEPGADGWLFFRTTLWRGDVADEEYARRLAAEWLGGDDADPAGTDAAGGLPFEVESVAFSELRTDEAYYEAFKREIAADLETFNAEHVSEVLSKYLGSSIRVTDGS